MFKGSKSIIIHENFQNNRIFQHNVLIPQYLLAWVDVNWGYCLTQNQWGSFLIRIQWDSCLTQNQWGSCLTQNQWGSCLTQNKMGILPHPTSNGDFAWSKSDSCLTWMGDILICFIMVYIIIVSYYYNMYLLNCIIIILYFFAQKKISGCPRCHKFLKTVTKFEHILENSSIFLKIWVYSKTLHD